VQSLVVQLLVSRAASVLEDCLYESVHVVVEALQFCSCSMLHPTFSVEA